MFPVLPCFSFIEFPIYFSVESMSVPSKLPSPELAAGIIALPLILSET